MSGFSTVTVDRRPGGQDPAWSCCSASRTPTPPRIAAALAAKIWQLRIMDDEKSASDLGAGVLVVSQFTLYADTRKGRRPVLVGRRAGAGVRAAL